MVKLFIGNIPPEATPSELKALFEQYGKVTECDIITNYGFVHMEDKKSADEAVANLNQYKLHDVSINVEHSRGKPKASTKLHVSSISPDCTSDELREKFEEYGAVLECDIVKDFAFVHMEKAEEALEAIRNLNNYDFKGKRMHVQLSTSRLRVTPGMGERSQCYRCGKDGHWSGVCPLDQMAQEVDLASPYGHDPFADPYVPMRNAAATAYEQMYYERERRNLIDYYHRYRIRPSTYDAYMDRRMPPIPPPTMSGITHRKRLETSPYERQALPPPPPIPSYYARERSPIRRPPPPPATAAVDEYVADRSLAPTMRSTLYETPRYMRNTYADRTRYY
ncbi:RNA-binding protein 4B-like isoform X1 [Ranitomeya imitator]|uniref:RNA-binding protein 4B-like isoform X1 n=1 Tax=Ranitomeya imitator TaxID=111125 RepID=UPI001AA4FDFD